jgi:hypothetical protein
LSASATLPSLDRKLLRNPSVRAEPPSSEASIDLTRWTAAQLTEGDITYLRQLPMTFDLTLSASLSLRCFHASPRSFDDVIAAPDSGAELVEMGIVDHRCVYAGGHTHVQMVRRHGDAHVINPGSVGLPGVGPGTPDLPVNRAVSWAEYAVVSDSEVGFAVTLRRLPLDIELVLSAARTSGMPHLDWWLSKWDLP